MSIGLRWSISASPTQAIDHLPDVRCGLDDAVDLIGRNKGPGPEVPCRPQRPATPSGQQPASSDQRPATSSQQPADVQRRTGGAGRDAGGDHWRGSCGGTRSECDTGTQDVGADQGVEEGTDGRLETIPLRFRGRFLLARQRRAAPGLPIAGPACVLPCPPHDADARSERVPCRPPGPCAAAARTRPGSLRRPLRHHPQSRRARALAGPAPDSPHSEPVRLAGRIGNLRNSGKLLFATLYDRSRADAYRQQSLAGRADIDGAEGKKERGIQLFVDLKSVGEAG